MYFFHAYAYVLPAGGRPLTRCWLKWHSQCNRNTENSDFRSLSHPVPLSLWLCQQCDGICGGLERCVRWPRSETIQRGHSTALQASTGTRVLTPTSTLVGGRFVFSSAGPKTSAPVPLCDHTMTLTLVVLNHVLMSRNVKAGGSRAPVSQMPNSDFPTSHSSSRMEYRLRKKFLPSRALFICNDVPFLAGHPHRRSQKRTGGVYIVQFKSSSLPCKHVNLTVAPSVGNENSEANSGESFLPCHAERGHKGVSHTPVIERRYAD